MKGPDEVFTLSGIYPSLSTDRAVHLREQAGWNLNKTHTAA
jgi:hypothetical protein